MQNVAHTYFKTQFSTMGQGEVLLLLYDGALKFLAQAKEKIRTKDPGGKGICISKALDIVAELDATLNLELGGELAQNLHQLYMICSTRLLKANLEQDIPLIDSVIDVLEGLRSAYAEILNQPEAQQATEQIAARRKAFAIKGSANMTMQPVMPPGFGGGGRAQSAYTTAARQVTPAQPEQPVAQPATSSMPAGATPVAAGLQGVSPQRTTDVASAVPVAPVAPVAPVSGPYAAAATAAYAHASAPQSTPPPTLPAAVAAVPTEHTVDPTGAQPSAQTQNALLNPLPAGIRRSASVAAYGRVAQLRQS